MDQYRDSLGLRGVPSAPYLKHHFGKWMDSYGFFHLRPYPEPEQSENPVTFTGTAYVIAAISGLATSSDRANLDATFSHLRTDAPGVFRPTAVSQSDHFSHDQATPLVCASKLYGLTYHKEIRLFQKHHRHPRDIVFLAWMKGGAHKLWAFFFLWIPIIAMIVSCWQTHKVRNGNHIVKTDGKILAWVRLQTLMRESGRIMRFFWWIVWKICDLVTTDRPRYITQDKKLNVQEFWSWDRWEDVFKYYFKHEGHPNRELIKYWEDFH